jgi:anti-anti-sigma factor
MALEIKQEEQGALRIMTLLGRLDTETSPDFELAAHDAFESGGRQFVVDLSQISYISSAGLRVLLALAKKVEGQGSLKLASMQPVVREVFDKSGFARLFQIFPRLDAALGGAAPVAASAPQGNQVAQTAADLLGVKAAPPPRAAAAPQAQKSGGGFFGWLKRLFGGK